MSGGQDNKKRMLPVRVQPEGIITWEDPAIAVMVTLRLRRPQLSYTATGFAVAWTRNAVYCIWRDETGAHRTGWLPPADVKRI